MSGPTNKTKNKYYSQNDKIYTNLFNAVWNMTDSISSTNWIIVLKEKSKTTQTLFYKLHYRLLLQCQHAYKLVSNLEGSKTSLFIQTHYINCTSCKG